MSWILAVRFTGFCFLLSTHFKQMGTPFSYSWVSSLLQRAHNAMMDASPHFKEKSEFMRCGDSLENRFWASTLSRRQFGVVKPRLYATRQSDGNGKKARWAFGSGRACTLTATIKPSKIRTDPLRNPRTLLSRCTINRSEKNYVLLKRPSISSASGSYKCA